MKLGTALLPIIALSFTTLAFSGCAAQTDATDGADDQETEVDETESTEEALTSTPSNYGYWIVTHRDFRRCISPICGGWWVKRVNQAKTLCANGMMESECYVSSISFNGVGLSAREEADVRASVESGKAVIKAKGYKKKFNGIAIGTLKANEAWTSATGSTIDGTFFRLADNGIRCIQAPCPSTTAHTLNSADKQNIIDAILDQTSVPADQDTLDRASTAIGTTDGLIVAGGLLLPKCIPNSQCGPKVNASEIFLKVVRREGKGCGSRGLPYTCNSGQFCSYTPTAICGWADAAGKCAYKPEACIKIYQPVCGCDGQTHGNSCMAASAGTSVASQGACAK
jgi:hypothetical protein